MKKFLKWFAIILGGLILLAIIMGLIVHEKLPAGKSGPEAEALAQKMTEAVNKEAWDTTRYVQWTFMEMHDFLWNKEAQLVQVEWNDNRVILDEKTQEGMAWSEGEAVEGEAKAKLLQQAWSLFCNDSFWLNAPVKAFDPGTSRSVVDLDNGEKGLLVTYTGGGVTPGDSYLWLLDNSGLPKAWKMWVKIIPIGGVETSWSDWIELPTGAKLATSHKGTLGTLRLSNIRGAMSLRELGIEEVR